MPKINVNLTLTKDYRKNYCFASQKTNPIQTQSLKGQNRLPKNPGKLSESRRAGNWKGEIQEAVEARCREDTSQAKERYSAEEKKKRWQQTQEGRYSRKNKEIGSEIIKLFPQVRTGKEIRPWPPAGEFRFGSSEDKAGKEAKRRPTGW